MVDFANTLDTIRANFSDYYEATQLDAATDPDVIYNLAERLDGYHVYETTEVVAVASAYFDELDPSAVLRKFLRSYSFITQVIGLGDEDLYRLFVYAGFRAICTVPYTGDPSSSK